MSTTPMTIANGQLSSAAWLSSPNKNDRPTQPHSSDSDPSPYIDTIVIHNISLPPNEFAQTDSNGLHYVKALFTNTLDWDAHPYFQTIKGALKDGNDQAQRALWRTSRDKCTPETGQKRRNRGWILLRVFSPLLQLKG